MASYGHYWRTLRSVADRIDRVFWVYMSHFFFLFRFFYANRQLLLILTCCIKVFGVTITGEEKSTLRTDVADRTIELHFFDMLHTLSIIIEFNLWQLISLTNMLIWINSKNNSATQMSKYDDFGRFWGSSKILGSVADRTLRTDKKFHFKK